ncbi:MAG TPA: pseudouridine synthase [Myxococcota bacterium]|nr:pseudouridine synthase [Myxococcota bacterium]
MTEVYLQKLLASRGLASRREAERLIAAGRVSVNGCVVTVPGTKVDPASDKLALDGTPVREATRGIYLLLNKPRGFLSAASDPAGRPTVFELLKGRAATRGARRVFHVGRLDSNSEGLLLFTNDGLLAHALTHPSRQVPRTYRVRVRGTLTQADIGRLRSGVDLEDGPARVTKARIVKRNQGSTWLEIVVAEGRNRLVRRLFSRLGHQVVRLVRVAYGGVELGDLPRGTVRELSPEEIAILRRWQTRPEERER